MRSPLALVLPRILCRSMAAGVTAAVLQLGCGSDQAVSFTSSEPPEPALARLFLNGGDVTHHVPLNSGHAQEIEVRLHAANGTRIVGYDDHFELSIEVTPAGLARAEDVDGRPLVKLLTPTAPPDELGSLRLIVRHTHTMTTRTFGPFEVLVH